MQDPHIGTTMKIYTKTGDSGETGLFAGPRVWKDDPRIEAFGAVDELNAILGWVRVEYSTVDSPEVDSPEVDSPEVDSPEAKPPALLAQIQHQLFSIGAELATPDPSRHGTDLVGHAEIAALETAMDSMEATLPPLKQFILPGGSRAAAALHVARSVCRRAERRVVSLRRVSGEGVSGKGDSGEGVSDRLVQYLNRLGDYLFVLARFANHQAGCGDVPWQKPR